MTRPSIVGFTGLARAGKDTAAKIVAAHGYRRESFAAPLREFVARILGISLEELEERKEQPVPWLGGITPRRLMQTVGTEWGRGQHPDLWVLSMVARIRATGFPRFVISDVRFNNEAIAIKEMGGVVWHITRHGSGTREVHASEAGVRDDLVDAVIENNGSVGDLTSALARLLR